MAQISRAYKLEVPMLIRVLYKSFNCQRCEYSYYEILGVSPNATQKEIKTAYIKLSKEMHPDSGTKGNHADFVKINEAYTILSRKESRYFYDAQLKSHTIHGSNSYRHTEYNDFHKQWETYNMYRSQDKRKVTTKDRNRALKICIITIIIGLFIQLIMIKSWSDHNRAIALRRSTKIQMEYERSKKQHEGKTLEERLQIIDEMRKKYK